jgi:hypothetical protein
MSDTDGNNPLLFRLLDYVAGVLSGVISALFTALVVSPNWPLPVGMFSGMILGMAALMIVFLALGWIAGGFEMLMQGMSIVMVVGMVCGMWITMASPKISGLLLFGFFAGLCIATVFHFYDKSMHGEVTWRNE